MPDYSKVNNYKSVENIDPSKHTSNEEKERMG
jgi:hypothetical protein